MYDRETVELLLPGVCWNHHLHTTRTETGRKGHVCSRNEAFWAAPPSKPPKQSVDPGKYRVIDWPTGDELDAMAEPVLKKWKSKIERAVDPDKRPTFSNPKHANTIWAELIDVQRGWDQANLTLKERQALLLAYGMYWQVTEIAHNQGVSKQAISLRIITALEKITAHLNGDEIEEEVAA